MPIRIARYVRISSDAGIEESYSPEVQRSAVAEFCQRQGWDIVADYQDLGISGWRQVDRPGFNAMIADAQVGKFDVVCVYKMDRFSRRTDSAVYRTLLQKHNVRVVSATEPTDDNAAGEMLTGVLGVMAQFYSAALSERVRAALRARAEHGLQSGDIPFGYCRGRCEVCCEPNGPGYCPDVGQIDKVGGRQVVIHPRDAEGVRLIFDTYATGNASCRDITIMLNERGFRINSCHKRRDNARPFTRCTIEYILKNPFYIGLIRHRGQLLPGTQVPLVEASIFQRVQTMLVTRRRVPQNRSNQALIYPLTGLLFCAECGHTLVGSCMRVRGHTYSYYYDRGRHDGACAILPAYVQGRVIEAQIVDVVRRIQLPDDWRQQLATYYYGTKTEPEIEQERSRLELRKERLRDLYLEDMLTREAFLQEAKEIEAKQRELSMTALQESVDVGSIVADFPRIWDAATLAERKSLLRGLIRRIEVRGPTVLRIEPRPNFAALLKATGCELVTV